MDYDVSKLSQTFRIADGKYTSEHIQHGHINNTFRILRDGKPVYILQQINTAIFTDPDQLMANYRLVTETLAAYTWPESISLQVPGIICTSEGNLFYTDHQSNCLRLISYIEGTECNEVPRDNNTAYEGGLAFGAFLKSVSGIDPALLNTILPDFHSFQKRYADFLTALKSDPTCRGDKVHEEIAFVTNRYQAMMKIPEMLVSGAIPVRVVHNDTKLSNVVFSKNGKAVGVIDLDTVMPGSALFDFGDAIRSAANSAKEDEEDLTKVIFEIGFFKAFALGYLKSTHGLLTKTEIDFLPESALLLTCIIGIRFLTDYLNGDVYYHTQYMEHNLTRARVQFKLLSQMELQLTEMHTFTREIEQTMGNMGH